MAFEDEVPPKPPYTPTSGELHPELGAFQAPAEMQAWAAQAINQIQDHVTAHAIADAQIQKGQQFVTDLATTKQNLADMARSDPTAIPLALGLVDSFPDHGINGLNDHFKSEIVKSGIQGYANISRDAAHAAIDRYSEHLSDDEQLALRQHADQMDVLRQHDTAATYVQAAKDMVAGSNRNAIGWLGQLTDPATGDVRFPPKWGQAMMNDLKMAPEAKANLFMAYRNLQLNGDPEMSNPLVVSDLIHRAATGYQNPDHPDPHEIIGLVGDHLNVSDAGYLAGLAGPKDAGTKQYIQAMSDSLAAAREQIGNQQAYGRFVNWFLPAVRNGAVLDPGSKDFLLTPERMAQFQPTGDELLAPVVRAVEAKQRPSLGQIFAGGWTPPGPTPPSKPEKEFPDVPYDKGEDRYQEKGGPVKIPGGGSRPF